MTLTEFIRKNLAAQEETLYALARDTGVNRSVLRRFLAGHGVHSGQLDAIAEYLRIEPVIAPEAATKAKRRASKPGQTTKK